MEGAEGVWVAGGPLDTRVVLDENFRGLRPLPPIVVFLV